MLPDELRKQRPRYRHLWIYLGIALIPALIILCGTLPFHQEHLGLLLSAICAGGFTFWTSWNLITGVFRSNQGNYFRTDAPVRYWINTSLIGLGTVLGIAYYIHQCFVVLDA